MAAKAAEGERMNSIQSSWAAAHSVTQLEKARDYILKRLKKLTERSDDSIDADPTFALAQRNFLEGNLERVERQLLLARVSNSPLSDVVGIGNVIRVQRGSEMRKVMLIPATDMDPDVEYVSVKSVLGRALLGKRENDTVEIETELGTQNYGILRIS